MKIFESTSGLALGEIAELPEGQLWSFPRLDGGDSVWIAVCTTLVSTLLVNRSVDPGRIYFLALCSTAEVLEEEGFVLGLKDDLDGNVPSGNLALPLIPAKTPVGGSLNRPKTRMV